MPQRWTVEQALAIAPDASSAAAGRKLATSGSWSSTGAAPGVVWGLCAGSGSTPYQTVVDLTEPAFSCSCPSRKFPCKHALALLLRWAGGEVAEHDEPADFAATWLEARAARAARSAERAEVRAERTPSDPRAAGRREQREQRVAAGVAELERWLRDQVRTGVASADTAGYALTDPVAARLVDAQAPGLAAAVRRLASVAASGEGWPGRLLEELALVHLLVTAHGRLDELPADLAQTVRTRAGATVRTEDVLAGPPVRDRWDVLALRDSSDGRLTTRRVHVRGAGTGRDALVLSFAGPGQVLDVSLVPGTSLDADLHLYPGALPLRAVVGTRHGEPGPLSAVTGCGVRDALAAWAGALAADPWTADLPVVLADVQVVATRDGTPDGWLVADAAGDALPLVPAAGLWTVLAIAGGHPVTLVGALTPRGVRAESVLADAALVPA
ncbi:SWIM zinc finger family protein [Cellulomonas sp. NPDC055163]